MLEDLNQDEVKIYKVHIHEDDALRVEWKTSKEDTQKQDEYNVKFHNIMHADLKTIFKKLAVHIALVTEYVEQPQIKANNIKEPYDTQSGHALFAPFECRHYSRNWSEAREGIVLSGVRRLKSKRVVSLSTPFLEMDPAKCDYPYIELLLNIVTEFEDEVFKYITGEKFAVRQLELSDQD